MNEAVNTEEEQEVLSRENAEKCAKDFRNKPDPFSEIPPSLLSAEHIENYIEKTGLIGPYFRGGGKKSRLKKAAYEGRTGTCAYVYNKRDELVSISLKENLKVPANSIVFVECDLDFRLPEYIALRFNLQIRHVHRGLLLGTGPLVDPGYWGKLCIPLHNLTDEDYEIPLIEGLIWIEFTKTTSDLKGEDPIGRPPLDKEFWNIKDFIEKASSSFKKGVAPVAIRSSIPLMVAEANERSEEARVKSEQAEKLATDAEAAVKVVRNLSVIAAVAVIIGVLSLWGTFYSGMNFLHKSVGSQVDQLQRDVAGNAKGIDGAVQRNDKAQTKISATHDELRKADSRLSDIEQENKNLISRIIELESALESQKSESSKPE